jgi:hypothetical protein
MSSAIEQRLQQAKNSNGEKLFLQLESVLDFSELKGKAIPKARCGYLVPISQKPKVMVNDLTGSVHEITETFGIFIGLQSINDPKMKKANALIHNFISDLRRELLGFSPIDLENPEVNYQPITLAGSNLSSIADNGIWWLERFSTTYYLESTYDN